MDFTRIYRRKTPSRRKFDTRKLRDGEIRDQFVERLKDDLGSITPERSVNENWNNIKRIFANVSQEVLGYQENQRKDYISDETLKIIEERKKVKIKRCAESNLQRIRELDQVYNELNKKVKRSVRRDWRQYLDGLAEEAQSAASMGHISQVYKAINKLSCKPAHPRVPVKNKAGKVLTNMEEQLRRWREHFEEILNQPCEPTEDLDDNETPSLRIKTDPPSRAEIVQALKEMKNNKAAGIDGIPAEILKADLNVIAYTLLPFFSDIWTSETIPDEWKRGVIVEIPKKGDIFFLHRSMNLSQVWGMDRRSVDRAINE